MSIRQKLQHELKALALAALYFGVWIGTLILLKKLMLAEYRIQFHGLSLALVGTLVLSKVVLVLEHLPLGDWLKPRSALTVAFVRTAVYSLGVLVVLLLERGFEGMHEYGGFGPSLTAMFQHADVYHVLANTICLSGALLGYNLIYVVQRQLGESGLIQLLMSPLREELGSEDPEASSRS